VEVVEIVRGEAWALDFAAVHFRLFHETGLFARRGEAKLAPVDDRLPPPLAVGKTDSYSFSGATLSA
jgi:hypothetical protein